MTLCSHVPGLEPGQRGIFWDGDTSHPWKVLGHQLAGIVAISAWSMGWSAIVFGTLKYAGGNIGLLGGKEYDNSLKDIEILGIVNSDHPNIFSYFKILRVAIDDEEIGMDIIKHGEAAYPVAAWREYQYRSGGDNIENV